MNENEEKVIEKYKREGWKVLRGGAPDFLMLKVDGEEIVDFEFVEAKTPRDRLSYEQAIYKKVLEKLGAKYRVEVVPIQSEPRHPRPGQATPNHAVPFQTAPTQTNPTPLHPRPAPTNPIPTRPRHTSPPQT